MKLPLISLAPLLFLTACGCSQKPQASAPSSGADSNNLAFVRLLEQQQLGRYQLFSSTIVDDDHRSVPALFKIDSATGSTWRFQQWSIEYSNADAFAEGWVELGPFDPHPPPANIHLK